jgi:hypothetical protein
MHSALRNPIAAFMLFMPAAAMVVAPPVQAQQRAVVAQPAIRALALDSNAGLAPGAVLRVQLVATPGAKNASVVLANGVRVALRERGAGTYVGSHTVKRSDRIDPRRLIAARASFGQRTVAQDFSFPASFQALAMGGPAARDRQAPRISEVTPSKGARVGERGRTFIHARLSDAGTGVDPRTVRLLVDGLDVTRNADVTEHDIGYRERLGRGRHNAELVVRDRAGNVNRTFWTFQVV